MAHAAPALTGGQAAETLRSLIGENVLTPETNRGKVRAELRGELFGILDFAKAEETDRPARFSPQSHPKTAHQAMRWGIHLPILADLTA